MRRTSSKTLRSSVEEKGLHGFNQVGRIRLTLAHSQPLSAFRRKRRSPLGRTLAVKTGKGALIACLVALPLVPAFAWVYPEHRDITLLAVQRLDPEQRELLHKLWLEARSVNQGHLCPNVVEPAQGLNPTCLDYAAWTAIAGDHSCSGRDMLSIVLDAPWVLNVARVSARLKVQLAAARRRDQRANAVRSSDIALQRADPEYVTRASSNNAHFLLARPDVTMQPVAYARLALGANADLNALATYLWYHLRALATASRLSRGGVSPETRAQVVRAALADEAFAQRRHRRLREDGHDRSDVIVTAFCAGNALCLADVK